MQIADSHIVKLVSIKANTPDSESNFLKMLQDGIEILIRCMEIRAFAKLWLNLWVYTSNANDNKFKYD